MKQRVAVVTINDIKPNYGNLLQNYASLCVYRELGFKADTLVTQEQSNYYKFLVKRILHEFNISRFNDCAVVKEYNFLKFARKYLSQNFSYIQEKLNITQYDFFSVGSDQVWNPAWYYGKREDAFLLKFCNQNQKIAFAPSFGVKSIPEEWEDVFAKYLSEIKYLSVREEAGARIIKELTGKDSKVLIDPTLFLDGNRWRHVSKKPKGISKENYILTYFLGGINPAQNEYMNTLAEREGLKKYNLLDKSQPEIFVSGPSEFLWLFDHASIVLTDSFHACVFSFLFNKPFIVYDREGTGNTMNSRLETLLSTLCIERKYANSGLENNIWEHDYTEGYKQLVIEREKVIKFLRESLGVE